MWPQPPLGLAGRLPVQLRWSCVYVTKGGWTAVLESVPSLLSCRSALSSPSLTPSPLSQITNYRDYFSVLRDYLNTTRSWDSDYNHRKYGQGRTVRVYSYAHGAHTRIADMLCDCDAGPDALQGQ